MAVTETTTTEYGVYFSAKDMVVPIEDQAAERYKAGGDGKNAKLVSRTITVTVSEWEDRNGDPIT